MPQKNTAKRFWDDRKSILLTRLVTGGVFIACILIALAGPAIVDWLITRGRVAVTGPAVRGVMLGLGYVLAALALWMLWQLERLLARLGQGAVFVPANVQALRRIAWCCALAAVICVPAGAALLCTDRILYVLCFLGLLNQKRPVMRPSSSQSMSMAAGCLGRPGIVMSAPQMTTTKPAPADRRTSRTLSGKSSGAPSRPASSLNEYCVLAMQTGNLP